jgi:hypothetical protein
MAFLPTEATDLSDRHALNTFDAECVFNLFQFKVSDDRLDLFHGNPPETGMKCFGWLRGRIP